MKKIELTKSEFENLDHLYPGVGVPNSESDIYYYEDKLLKHFNLKGVSLSDKIDTVKYLDSDVRKLNIKELVLPEALVSIDGDVSGIIMEKQDDSKNLGLIFNDSDVPIDSKIAYLKKIGEVLAKVQNEDAEFNFCDFHPYNILVDSNKDIHIIDMDGVYLAGHQARPIYYLDINEAIDEVPSKYPRNVFGVPYSSNNADLLSYNLMILNVISKTRMQYKTRDEYYLYLNYLDSIGYGSNILDSFDKLYKEIDNVNPYLYLEEIPTDKEDISTFKSYVKNS